MISPLNKGVSQGGGAAPAGNQVIALRVAIIGAVLLGLFAIVFFRLWYLQVLSGDSLAAAASQNRTRTVAITAPRGPIVDRKGRTIVGNRRAQIVELAPASLPMLERSTANEYGQELQKWNDDVDGWRDDYVSVQTKAEKKKPKRQRKVVKRPGAYDTLPASVRARFPKPRIRGLDDPQMVRDYVDAGDQSDLTELKRRYDRLGWLLQLEPTEVRRRVITSYYLQPYANIPLRKSGADADVVNYVAENAEQFPGVSTTIKYVRSYPFHGAGAQLFGQVGALQVDADGKPTIAAYKNLKANAQVGLNGLEREYDGYLRGKDGGVKAQIDAFGNVSKEPEEIAPIRGDKLQLTIDRDLQERALKSMALGSKFNPSSKPGAIIAMDPRNGEILAAQSNPTFDPAVFVRGVSQTEFEKFIDENGAKPLFNRVTDAGYAAGSTFKPVTSFAAVASGQATPSEIVGDNGFIKFGIQKFQNAGGVALGSVDLTSALVKSSDVYFYTMGARLNVTTPAEQLQSWARRLGYGRTTGIDLPSESSGTVPDRKWRERLSETERLCRKKNGIPNGPNYNVFAAAARGCGYTDQRTWSIGDNVQLAIGQGDIGVTPLQTAVMYSAIENGGKIVRPHLAKAIQDRNGATRQDLQFPAKRTVDLEGTGALEAVRNGLHGATSEPGGTSLQVFADWPQDRYPVYGKTGTVQREGKVDQSWFAAYVPDETRPIVVVATVEEGGFGASTAAPIVAQMLAQWYGINPKIEAGDSATT